MIENTDAIAILQDEIQLIAAKRVVIRAVPLGKYLERVDLLERGSMFDESIAACSVWRAPALPEETLLLVKDERSRAGEERGGSSNHEQRPKEHGQEMESGKRELARCRQRHAQLSYYQDSSAEKDERQQDGPCRWSELKASGIGPGNPVSPEAGSAARHGSPGDLLGKRVFECGSPINLKVRLVLKAPETKGSAPVLQVRQLPYKTLEHCDDPPSLFATLHGQPITANGNGANALAVTNGHLAG